MRVRRAVLLLLPAALAATVISVPPLTVTAADVISVPAATLTEINVPGTTPLSATAVDLEAAGYTAREFYAEGLANRYTGASCQHVHDRDGSRRRQSVSHAGDGAIPEAAQVQRDVGR